MCKVVFGGWRERKCVLANMPFTDCCCKGFRPKCNEFSAASGKKKDKIALVILECNRGEREKEKETQRERKRESIPRR